MQDEVIRVWADYLRIYALGFMPVAVTSILSAYLRCVQAAKDFPRGRRCKADDKARACSVCHSCAMALEMLAAYYSCGCDSRELFAGFKIAQDKDFEKYLNQYDVVYLNMQQFLIRTKRQDIVQYLEQIVLEEFRETYGSYFSGQIIDLVQRLKRFLWKQENRLFF